MWTPGASRKNAICHGLSLLAAARYESKARRLALKFRKGSIYYYLDVPRTVYDSLLAAPSPGAFFVQSIRDEYRFVVVQE
jgi:hypothetical protein